MPKLPTIAFVEMGSVKVDEPLSADAALDITVQLSSCGRCGAVILDETRHAAWHNEAERSRS